MKRHVHSAGDRSRSRSVRRERLDALAHHGVATTRAEVHGPKDEQAEKIAVVTLATAAYGGGALVLSAALQHLLGPYADIIVFSDDELFLPLGVQQRSLNELPDVPVPPSAGQPMQPQFSFCWAKLGLWSLRSYDVVVYMDADMLPIGDIAGLLQELPGPGSVAAVPACQCWCEEACSYAARVLPGSQRFYFNAGLFIFRPCPMEFDSMMVALAKTHRPFPFAEQDFLNEHFAGRVLMLPWKYNALKHTFCNPRHLDHVSLKEAAVLHFVMAKPWERLAKLEDEFEELHALWWQAYRQAMEVCFLRPRWDRCSVDPKLPDFWYVPGFIKPEMEVALLKSLQEPALGRRWQRLRRREVLCLGGVPHPDGAICEEVQGPIGRLGQALANIGALSAAPDQCFVNRYSPGQGIDAHMDGPRFHSEVAIVSLQNPASIFFGLIDKKARPDLPRRLEVLLEPLSLLVFRAEAYELYVHGIDSIGPVAVQKEALAPCQYQRTSLTFRRLKHVQLCSGDVATDSQRASRDSQWQWWATELSEID